MDISADSMFLVTLSKGYPQQIRIWEWTVGTEVPAISANMGEDQGYQHSVRFNPVDVRDIVSTGQNDVIFWNWTQAALMPFYPPRGVKKIKGSVGMLTQTAFVPFTTKAVTVTSSGIDFIYIYIYIYIIIDSTLILFRFLLLLLYFKIDIFILTSNQSHVKIIICLLLFLYKIINY